MIRHGFRAWASPMLLGRLVLNRLWRLGTIYGALFLAVALAIWLIERNVEGTNVSTLIDSIWLAICTISTVGYGDTYPVTTLGRVIVGVFILFTMVTIGFQGPFADEAYIAPPKIFPLIEFLLTKKLILAGMGCVISLPGGKDQNVHRDYTNIYNPEFYYPGVEDYLAKAKDTVDYVAGLLSRAPSAAPRMAVAYARWLAESESQ